MKSIIAANPVIKIFTEFQPGGLKLVGTDPAEFLRMFETFGLRIYHLNYQKQQLEQLSAGELTARYSAAGNDYKKSGNLLCMKAAADF
jgi:hypothetical protein